MLLLFHFYHVLHHNFLISSYASVDPHPHITVMHFDQKLCRNELQIFRYHIGTLAFGALIIAIVRFIRMIFEYIDYKIKQHTDNMVVKILSCCCRCCLWCLEKFLRFINRLVFASIPSPLKVKSLPWLSLCGYECLYNFVRGQFTLK